jgi:plasmid stabilization system protein ParE
MKHRVAVLSRAQLDVASCHDFIAKRSTRGAASWFNRFAEIRDRLADDPERCAIAPESEFVDYEIRQVTFKTPFGLLYRILFTIVNDEVRILRVRGPGQDLVPPGELQRLEPRV